MNEYINPGVIISLFATIFAWRVHKHYDICVHSYARMLSAIDLIKKEMKQNTLLSIPVNSQSIKWLSELFIDKIIIEKILKDDITNDSYNCFLAILDKLDTQRIADALRLKVEIQNDIDHLAEKIKMSELFHFIEHPYKQYFILKLKHIKHALCR